LNEQFFSPENVNYLQDEIRAAVRQMVRADIDRQSEVDLMLVMRSYYLQYAENNAMNTELELRTLNERVVNFCANRIAVEVEAYRHYRKDILDFPAPIARPIDTQIYGTRTGELKSFF
jgi:chromosome condensin MukBEF complex kleisin-like MukF subunit